MIDADCLVQISTGEEAFYARYETGIFDFSITEGAGRGRRSRKIRIRDLRRIRLIVDNSMVEIYINDGEYVMTSRFYFPEKNARNFNIHRLFVLKKVGGCCMSALL